MITNGNSRRLLCVSGPLALVATGLMPCAASAAYMINVEVGDPDDTIFYTVTCGAGDPSFDVFELKIDPADIDPVQVLGQDVTYAYAAGALPEGWGFIFVVDNQGTPVPIVFQVNDQRFVKLEGPALTCPSPEGEYLFDIHYTGPFGINNVGATLKNPITGMPVHAQCVTGWAMMDLWPKVPTVSEWGLIIMALLLLTAGTIVFARRRRPAVA